jgi:hypothetical protein
MKTRHLTLVALFAAVLLCTSCDPTQVVLRNNAYLYSQDAEIEVILPSPYGNDTVIHRLSEESPEYACGAIVNWIRKDKDRTAYAGYEYIMVRKISGEAPVYVSGKYNLKINDSEAEFWAADGKYTVAEKIELMKKADCIVEISDTDPHRIDLSPDASTLCTITTP